MISRGLRLREIVQLRKSYRLFRQENNEIALGKVGRKAPLFIHQNKYPPT